MTNSDNFKEHLILEKKAVFLFTVEQAAKAIGAVIPYVNFDGCAFGNNEKAHIHIEQNLICVKESYLKLATHDDLKNTAMHEVAHIINQSHDPSFVGLHTQIKTHLWKPPALPSRITFSDSERERFYAYMEEDIRKWNPIYTDENGEEYFLKGRKGFIKYLKDEIPNYKPRCILVQTKRVSSQTKPPHDVIQKCDCCGNGYLNTSISLLFTCHYCGGDFCDDHRLPENHGCFNLELFKKRHEPIINIDLSNEPIAGKTTDIIPPEVNKHDNISDVNKGCHENPSCSVVSYSVEEKHRREYVGTTFHNDSEAKAKESIKYGRSGYKLFAIIICIIIIISFAIFVVTLNTSKRTIPVTIPVNDLQQNSGSPFVGTWKFENTQGIISTIIFDENDNAILDGKPFKYSIVGSNLVLKDNKSSSAIPYKLIDGNNLLLKLRGTNYEHYVKDIKNPVVTLTPIVTQ